MPQNSVQRFYPIEGLNFRDFWDLCRHYQTVHPECKVVSYTIDGFKNYIVLEETDVGLILKKLGEAKDRIRKYVARFFATAPGSETEVAATTSASGSAELVYRPAAYDDHAAGLSFFSDNATKLSLYQFENLIYTNYELEASQEPQIEFGRPCEVLAAVIDMRGFSSFCEKPNIESPYTCALMTAFYHMVKVSFQRYPPELLKFLGDGVLAVWQTTVDDRQIAVEIMLRSAVDLNRHWQLVRRNPHFTHGAPEEIGVGLGFGLASKISVDNDYIGRPINIASRLCGVCPGGRVLIDRQFPPLPDNLEKREQRVRLKSFGDYAVWVLNYDG